MSEQQRVAFVGNPNSGKTTLFNTLSGLRAKTANYPGVTVTSRQATVSVGGGVQVEIVDLPGTYSLDPISPDEAIVAALLTGEEPPDAVALVVDGTTLERSMLFIGEVLRLGMPTCVVVTMNDEVAVRGGAIDTEQMSTALGVPVISVVGTSGVGVDGLREKLADPSAWERPLVLPPDDLLARSSWADSVYERSVRTLLPDTRTQRIDAVLLHPISGVAVFVIVMTLFFQAIFVVAAPIIDWLDGFVSSLGSAVSDAVPGLLGDIIGDALIGGVGSVIVFVPQLAILFAILSVLEKVGYLARAAFLADRAMSRFGLEGRSFVAMLSSFACAVPGIMATKTIPDERRRIATIMASPLMTCSARLPVYTLLIGAFVANDTIIGPLRRQGLVLGGLYILGALSGLVYAWMVDRFGTGSAVSPFILELPAYRMPSLRAIVLDVWDGVRAFIRKAGTIILTTTVVLWALLQFPSAGEGANPMEASLAGQLGQALEPVTAPLGFDWQINVGLIGAQAAREVFVSTLALTTTGGTEEGLSERIQTLERADGSLLFDGPTVAALLVFFVYALQCFSTVATIRRETNGWRWPAIAFVSMFAVAYAGAYVARLIVAGVA